MPHRRSPRGIALLALAALAAWARPACATVGTGNPAGPYTGWAVEAYPELSAAGAVALTRRLAEAGANVVWIGHNNPGEVEANKAEPGLSFAVYQAFCDPGDPAHADAVQMIGALHRLLGACRTAGVKAVLAVGYQIQMGRSWNAAHGADLRLDADGKPLDIFGGGLSASFYAPAYREAMEGYYRWADAEFVRPYADVVMMLNLADEPIGGDYSAAADAEFRRRHGFGFAEVGGDPERQRLLGEFQSRYVVEYAAYSARLWQSIHPGLTVTMSFDGAQARLSYHMPDVEALFRDTPSNFTVTFDAYPHDGLPQEAISQADMTGLFLLARSIGLYSARYRRPVWLWAAANSWGLSGSSPDPGTVSDAVVNGLALALLVRQGGGWLQGIAYWNYNVKGQGLYNDPNTRTDQADAMFERVSAAFVALRRAMAAPGAQPQVLVLAPQAAAYQQIGKERTAIRLEGQPFGRLALLARTGINAAVVGTLDGRALDGVQTVVVLSPAVAYLSESDLVVLRAFLAKGGKAVVSQEVGQALYPAPGGAPALLYDGLIAQRDGLYVATQGVAVLFEDRRHDLLGPFWRDVLGIDEVRPGYWIVTADAALIYHPGPGQAKVRLDLPFDAAGYHYDAAARPVGRLLGPVPAATLERREFLFIQRTRWPTPWF